MNCNTKTASSPAPAGTERQPSPDASQQEATHRAPCEFLTDPILKKLGDNVDFPTLVTNALEKSIQALIENKDSYVANPGVSFSRNRSLPLDKVVRILLTMGAKSLQNELLNYFNFDEDTPYDSAFCMQRQKLLPEGMQFVMNTFNKNLDELMTPTKFRGMQVFAYDGSDVLLPTDRNDTDTYVNGIKGSGYNCRHLNSLCDPLTHRIYAYSFETTKKSDERSELLTLCKTVQPGSLILSDRGMEGYNVCAGIMNAGQHFITRIKDINSNGMLSGLVDRLPNDDEFDKTITMILTRSQARKFKEDPRYKVLMPNIAFDYYDKSDTYEITLRFLRFKLDNGEYECLVTDLPEDIMPASDFKAVYFWRWNGSENTFRDLKYTLAGVSIKRRIIP